MDARWEEFGWERLAPGGRPAPPSRLGRARSAWSSVAERRAAHRHRLDPRARALELRPQAQGLPGRRVTHIALTHAHFDHVFGTAAFAGARGVRRGRRSTDLLVREPDALRADAVGTGVDPGAAAEAADALVPAGTGRRGEWTLDLGGGQVLLAQRRPRPHRPRPGGLSCPARPAVVFCGDLVEESGEPQAGPDAVPSRWPAALDRLLALGGEDALYVPGTARSWTRRSYAPNATPWRPGSACRSRWRRASSIVVRMRSSTART